MADRDRARHSSKDKFHLTMYYLPCMASLLPESFEDSATMHLSALQTNHREITVISGRGHYVWRWGRMFSHGGGGEKMCGKRESLRAADYREPLKGSSQVV